MAGRDWKLHDMRLEDEDVPASPDVLGKHGINISIGLPEISCLADRQPTSRDTNLKPPVQTNSRPILKAQSSGLRVSTLQRPNLAEKPALNLAKESELGRLHPLDLDSLLLAT
ncbi:unnamed protein product [Dovyalis caffra]|uniref:Uncharacterized protein n=1 Tax=Dovyalis caffra TaxID=77055 RepID=A0AAV1R2S2_9ROSI|nr:unnamed protein product [Dovyalis caffra]